MSPSMNQAASFPFFLKSSFRKGNTHAFLRIRLVSYWEDSNGSIVARASQMPDFSVSTGWIEGSDHTYYYAQPVAPGESTPNLLETSILLGREGNHLQVVAVFADAIQSRPEDAVTESWGVTMSSGSITAAP